MLLILKTDTPSPQVVEKEGDYGRIFANRMEAAGYDGPTRSYDVVSGEYPDLGTLNKDKDTVLITGSKSNAWEDDKWIIDLVAFTKRLVEADIRIVGICFGHQIVGRALNADVGRAESGWEISSSKIVLTELGEKVFSGLGNELAIMQMHRDEVRELPMDTELLAHTPGTPVQGFYRKNKLLCLQGHPEFNQFIIEAILNLRFEGELKADGLARAAGPNDGPKINKHIVRFINGEL